MTLPKEAGLYWAHEKGDEKKRSFILQIKGDAPFLFLSGSFDPVAGGPNNRITFLMCGGNGDEKPFVFGPRIEVPGAAEFHND